MESKFAMLAYIIFFLLFCGVMEWRTRVLDARVSKAIDDLRSTNEQIQAVVKDIRK